MLQELSIRDFAIIEQLDLEFLPEMTVLTGETGAGKSIIIDALGLLAGARSSSEYLRKGCSKTTICGQFAFDLTSPVAQVLKKLGYRDEELKDGVVLQREIHRTGRNVCRINGNLVNLGVLRQVGSRLIDIHGQNEHQELMHPELHLGLLDSYSEKIAPVKAKYQTAYHQYQTLNQALLKRKSDEKLWAQRLDMLQFQVNEIKAANLTVGQEEELTSQKQRLENFQTIQNALSQSYQLLANSGQDALTQMGDAVNLLSDIAEIDDAYNAIYQKVADAYYNLQDASRDLSDELDDLEWDEDKLDNVNAQLDTINQLKRKYGDSIAAILAYYKKIAAELDEMQQGDADFSKQEKAVQQAHQKAQVLAEKLAHVRKQAAAKLEQKVHAQLASLYMDKAVFEVRFTHQNHLGENGQDAVEFYLQANPGETMGPLAKIASGGELSRIMLALKTIFARQSGVTSIIFDEVDTGVSGRVAQAIAEKISQIARHSQVLCITHLPQVAAISDHHFFIEKKVANARTKTTVNALDAAQKVDEIARMLSGSEITPLTQQHAAELIKQATAIKQKQN